MSCSEIGEFFFSLFSLQIVNSLFGTADLSSYRYRISTIFYIYTFLTPFQSVVISDYAAMDRILRQEKKYILELIKQIKKTGCNVLLIQKSILRDAVNDLSLHYLQRAKIMVVTDVERNDVEVRTYLYLRTYLYFRTYLYLKIVFEDEVECISASFPNFSSTAQFICKTLHCQPVSTPEQMSPGKMGEADSVDEVSTGDDKVVKV